MSRPEAAREALRVLATPQAGAHVPSRETPVQTAVNGSGPDRTATTWAAVDLTPILEGGCAELPPVMLGRTDGAWLLYAGKVHAISGEPESGKGWLALAACAEQLGTGAPVTYLDFEDSPNTMVGRLLALGVEPHVIAERFAYVRPDEALTAEGRIDLDAVTANAPTLIVLDGVTEAMTMHGLAIEDNADVARWQHLLPRPLAATGAAVIEVDHVVKARDNRQRYQIGAQQKLAGIFVSYGLEVIEPFGRGRDGLVKVAVYKDRGGYVRQLGDGKTVAEMRLRSNDDGSSVTVTLEPPRADSDEGFRPTFLMQRLSEYIEDNPGVTRRELTRTASLVKGKSDAKDAALKLLAREGYVREIPDGRAVRHESVKPYREHLDERGPE